MAKRYDWAVFYENGTRDDFWLKYGPENEDDPRSAAMITDWRNDPFVKRFDEENNGVVLPYFESQDKERSIGFIFVNPPVDIDE